MSTNIGRGPIQRINLKSQVQVSSPGSKSCSRRGLSYLKEALLDNPISLIICYVVIQSENSIRIHPAIGSFLGSIRSENLFPVLATMCLEPEEPVIPQVSLDEILCCKFGVRSLAIHHLQNHNQG